GPTESAGRLLRVVTPSGAVPMPQHAEGHGDFRKMQQQSPSSSASGQPCAAATAGAYQLQGEGPGQATLRRLLVGSHSSQLLEKTPLYLACANSYSDVITFPVQENRQLNLADNFKRSPLMKAVQCQEECVAVLLQVGANPNLADADSDTTLHLALLLPNTTTVGLFLDYNANMQNQGTRPSEPLRSQRAAAAARHITPPGASESDPRVPGAGHGARQDCHRPHHARHSGIYVSPSPDPSSQPAA
ncbi:PREDICTED: putative ankyrin repeat domain-containing protein 30B-like, partial [Buceros rhinoceros silvestris]|uniref:putative ankyrin repeat domain-containing protein 30B-like n=1 Tax=Buceros rhinoceros silvestris TaxID=175836 RepID=UPI00052834DB